MKDVSRVPHPMVFGRWLKHLRAAHDLTQDALAEQVGCAGQTIRMFESGARRPYRTMAERLADVLAVEAMERDAFIQSARARTPNEPASVPTPSATARVVEQVDVALTQTITRTTLPMAPNVLIGRECEYACG